MTANRPRLVNCPVCQGRRTVPRILVRRWDTTVAEFIPCKRCVGQGVVVKDAA